MNEAGDWLDAAALQKLLQHEDPPVGERDLIEALILGHVNAKSGHTDFVKMVGHVKTHCDDWVIPRRLWKHRSSHLDLQNDKFIGKVGINEGNLLGIVGAGEFRARRLMFHEPQIRKFFNLTGETANISSPTLGLRRGRGRPAADGWPFICAALAIWVLRRGGRSDELALIGSEKVYADIDGILTFEWGIEGVSRSTCMRGVREFLERLKQVSSVQK